ncbi:hypothetical protein GcM3_223039, partial [Golovinomyces cichoracearum]
ANCPGNSSPDEIKGNLPKGKQVKRESTEDWSHHANQQILNEEKNKFERHQRAQEERLLRENLLPFLQQQATVDNSLTSPVMMQETSQTIKTHFNIPIDEYGVAQNEQLFATNAAKAASNVERTFNNDNKYEGTGDNFGYKIRIFKDACRRMDLAPS